MPRALQPLFRFASRLRFPQLFYLVLILFLLDVLVPDLIPFFDEILLGLLTILLANWKKAREQAENNRRFENAKRVDPE